MSILQLPEEVLHRAWASLPDEAAKGAWRLCCRRFRDVVFKHGTVLRWQVPSGTRQVLDLLPVLLSKFAAAGGSITELYLNKARLSDAHCQAMADAALSGELAKLRILELAQSTPHGAMMQMMLGLVFSHCRHLIILNLSNDGTGSDQCSVCKMLRAIPQPSLPFKGLQVLQLRDWDLSAEQLCALRDALLKSLTALVELDLYWWSWDAEDSAHVVEVLSAALASSSLKSIKVNCIGPAPDGLQARASMVLQSHACTLTHMAVWNLLTSSQLLVPILAHNSQVQTLEFCSISTSGDNAAANDNTHALLQALGRLTCLQALDFEIQQPHDPAPALRHLTGLTKLSIYGLEQQVLGAHNANAMADALRAMPHLRTLSLCSHHNDTGIMTGHIPASVACEVLQGCSAQLTSLECRAISVAADQPFQQLARLSAALMRLTSLQVLKVPSLMYEVDSTFLEEQYALAAAAVASALPHLPALTELDVGHSFGRGAQCYASTLRSAAFNIVFSACLAPCLSRLTLPRWLPDPDRLFADRLLESAHLGIEITYH